MTHVLRWIRTALAELWALVVDDGLLALCAVAAIGATYLLSRTDTPGTGDVTGWFLVLLVVLSVALAVRRAVVAAATRDTG